MEMPDVDNIAPIDIPSEAIRTPLMKVTVVNEYTKYRTHIAYWHDIDKCFYKTDGTKITDEVARTNPID